MTIVDESKTSKITEQKAFNALYADVRDGVIPVDIELHEIVDEIIESLLFHGACKERKRSWPKHKRMHQAKALLKVCTGKARVAKFKSVVAEYRQANKQANEIKQSST